MTAVEPSSVAAEPGLRRMAPASVALAGVAVSTAVVGTWLGLIPSPPSALVTANPLGTVATCALGAGAPSLTLPGTDCYDPSLR
jgi:disulfide bond formation protein DsbB